MIYLYLIISQFIINRQSDSLGLFKLESPSQSIRSIIQFLNYSFHYFE
jgi:hypothetical protein